MKPGTKDYLRGVAAKEILAPPYPPDLRVIGPEQRHAGTVLRFYFPTLSNERGEKVDLLPRPRFQYLRADTIIWSAGLIFLDTVTGRWRRYHCDIERANEIVETLNNWNALAALYEGDQIPAYARKTMFALEAKVGLVKEIVEDQT